MVSKYKQKVMNRKHEQLERHVISETLKGNRIVCQQVVYKGNGTSITRHERRAK